MSEPPPPPADPQAATSNTPMLVLAYVWILALVPLFVEKKDSEVQWHAKHGLVLFGAELILWVIYAIILAIPVLGCVVAPLMFLMFIGVLVVRIICIVKAINGDRFLIPGLSQYADRIPTPA